jgi:hypothetical protein
MPHSHAERRTEAYNFRSLRELMTYYSDFMPMDRIERSIRECALFFSVRRDATREQERLQFIGRCESAIKADLILLQEAFARKTGARATPRAARAATSGPARTPDRTA